MDHIFKTPNCELLEKYKRNSLGTMIGEDFSDMIQKSDL